MAQRKRDAASIITQEEVTPRLKKYDDCGRLPTTSLGFKGRSVCERGRSSNLSPSVDEAAAEFRYADLASLYTFQRTVGAPIQMRARMMFLPHLV